MFVGDKHCQNCDAPASGHIQGRLLTKACQNYQAILPEIICPECGEQDGHNQFCTRWT